MALLLDYVDFICMGGSNGNCTAIAADTDRLCQACQALSQHLCRLMLPGRHMQLLVVIMRVHDHNQKLHGQQGRVVM